MAELEKRYDTDYQEIINQLNDEFVQKCRLQRLWTLD